MFTLLAELIACHLDAGDQLALNGHSLLAECADAVPRDQFIAMLGHSLRNPPGAIGAGAKLLAREPLTEKQGQVGRQSAQACRAWPTLSAMCWTSRAAASAKASR
ncbi:MAG: hypothetical protein ABL956_01020 [Hyphomonadaceae bacterium]